MKFEYIVEPREVGSRKGKSLVVHIPSALVKDCKFDSNTIFSVKSDRIAGTMIFRKVYTKQKEILAGKSFELSSQQASTSDIQ